MKRYLLKRIPIVLGITGILSAAPPCLSFAAFQSSVNYTVRTDVIAGDGGVGASAAYGIRHSIAQPSAVGTSSSTDFINYAGFWIPAVLAQAIFGDINQDGAINLQDAILALQVLSCMAPVPGADLTAYITGQGAIGFRDIIYILQKTAGFRE